MESEGAYGAKMWYHHSMAALHIRLSRPLFPKSLLSTYSPSVMLGVRGYSQHTQLHYPTNLEMWETHHLLRLQMLQMSTHWSTLGRKKSNPKLKQNRLLASRSLTCFGGPHHHLCKRHQSYFIPSHASQICQPQPQEDWAMYNALCEFPPNQLRKCHKKAIDEGRKQTCISWLPTLVKLEKGTTVHPKKKKICNKVFVWHYWLYQNKILSPEIRTK